ncbi:MAG: beta-ketoacyl-ACP synthase II [Planctomycetaceae bacterium]|jgi:3-oxoacyl-[acyl-carrier-protein] synthase II|nr:beta-ketoacyl-ACP synthase II [Planctomycetaceae bacterium]
MQRVVVTGYGLVTPLGSHVEEVWKMICAGESGIRRASILGDREDIVPVKIAGECIDFSVTKYIPQREANRMELFAQYALGASIDAVNLSGLNFSELDRDRCAVIIGSGVGGLNEFESQHTRLITKGASRVSPFAIPKIMPNSAAGNISIHFGLTGASYAVSSACATSSNAIIDAVRMIRLGEADVILAGGSEASTTLLGVAGFAAMHALSMRNDEPQRASRPFDRDRDGFVIADGCGVLVLESYDHAARRGAKMLGEIIGFGLSSDGTHITQPDENGVGAMKAIKKSLEDAHVNSSDIDYINAHATSTILGDITETRAIKLAFGDWAYKIPISSTKSQIGHLLGGSGAVETIFCLLTIRDGIIPPTINLENPDPECDLDYTPLIARERKIKTVLSNSFGFGGHNASIVVAALR